MVVARRLDGTLQQISQRLLVMNHRYLDLDTQHNLCIALAEINQQRKT